jgi:hypothetical protein
MYDLLEKAQVELEEVVKFHLPKLTEGRALGAKQFLELEEELRRAVLKGAIIGERYAHEKPTIPAPSKEVQAELDALRGGLADQLEPLKSRESGVLPASQYRLPPRRIG